LTEVVLPPAIRTAEVCELGWNDHSLRPGSPGRSIWRGVVVAEVTATIPEGVGLHARPAALFVQAVNKVPVDVKIGRPGADGVNAKSILAVMSLGVKAGEQVVLSAEGADEALASLKEMLETPESHG
jgi:phosphocarrier protein